MSCVVATGDGVNRTGVVVDPFPIISKYWGWECLEYDCKKIQLQVSNTKSKSIWLQLCRAAWRRLWSLNIRMSDDIVVVDDVVFVDVFLDASVIRRTKQMFHPDLMTFYLLSFLVFSYIYVYNRMIITCHYSAVEIEFPCQVLYNNRPSTVRQREKQVSFLWCVDDCSSIRPLPRADV